MDSGTLLLGVSLIALAVSPSLTGVLALRASELKEQRPRARVRGSCGHGLLPLLALLLVLCSGPAAAQEVHGRVVESDTDGPVAGASVELLDGLAEDRVVLGILSDEDGLFRIRAPASGSYRLRVRRLGYRDSTTPLFDLVAREEPLEVEVLLGVEAIPLAPLVIVSERAARLDLRLVTRGFYERRRTWGREGMGFGHFFDRDEIQRRNPTQVVDLLRGVPGIRIEPRGGHRPGEITMRAITSIQGGGGLFGLRCSPLIFLDGSIVSTGSPDVGAGGMDPGTHIDYEVSVADLAGIEVYPGLTQPAEFIRGNLCGVVVLWTGDGAGSPPRWEGARFDDGRGLFSVEPRIGFAVGAYAPTSTGLHWAPAVTAGVVLEARVVPGLAVFLGASRTAFGCRRGECAEVDGGFVSTGWELGLRGDLDVPGRPWSRLGVTRSSLETRWVDGGERSRVSQPSGFGLTAQFGFEVAVARNLSLTPGVRLIRSSVPDRVDSPFRDPFTVRDHLWMIAVDAGVRFSF
jgi:hypothetical protein